MPETVTADPTKEFFVQMITKDISLEDCILDLLDNCVDGAKRVLGSNGQSGSSAHTKPYEGFWAKVSFDETHFSIVDNCGGLPVERAKKYAFRFGRDRNDPDDSKGSLGLYGIGMKRSIFKIGRKIEIQSSTTKDAFSMTIPVDVWLNSESWDFTLDQTSVKSTAGTSISISELNTGIDEEIGDRTFENDLMEVVARDYYHLIKEGFSIEINDNPVRPYPFEFRFSEEYSPLRKELDIAENVQLEIVAGYVRFPGGDDLQEPEENGREEQHRKYYGWYVMCNDRVVLAANQDHHTIWGVHQFSRWHQQYDGFIGLAMFKSDDPKLLPWTTTKRDVDEASTLYRKALTHMRDATKPFKDYSRSRRYSEDAKKFESRTKSVAVADIPPNTDFKLPSFSKEKPRTKEVMIRYTKPKSEVEKVRLAIGTNPSSREIGEFTFEYFVSMEVD